MLFRKKKPSNNIKLPDGRKIRIVENNKTTVVFTEDLDLFTVFYNFDKRTGKKVIRRIYKIF